MGCLFKSNLVDWQNVSFIIWTEMPEHIFINDEAYVYECLICGFISEPPWMKPPPHIALEARDLFILEHKHCKFIQKTNKVIEDN